MFHKFFDTLYFITHDGARSKTVIFLCTIEYSAIALEYCSQMISSNILSLPTYIIGGNQRNIDVLFIVHSP